MTIKVQFKDGSFHPLEQVDIPEGSVIRMEVVELESPPTGGDTGKRSLISILGTKRLGMPSEDFKDIPEGFEEYLQ